MLNVLTCEMPCTSERMTTANEIIAELRELFPDTLSREYDTTQGLIAGNPSKNIKKAVLSLEFRKNIPGRRADMILLHHPPIFGPKRAVTNPFFKKWKRNGEVVYAIHSRIDRAGFQSSAIAERLFGKAEYKAVRTLDDGTAIIELKRTTPIKEIINRIKRRLKLKRVNAIIKKKAVKNIGIHGGEGFNREHVALAAKEGIDLYLAGDISHHLAEHAHFFDINFVDIGHFSEQEGMRKLAEILEKRFPDVRFEYVEQRLLWSIE